MWRRPLPDDSGALAGNDLLLHFLSEVHRISVSGRTNLSERGRRLLRRAKSLRSQIGQQQQTRLPKLLRQMRDDALPGFGEVP